MTKISITTKIKAVEEYPNGTASLTTIRSKYGISKLEFQICVGIYAKFGKQALLNPPKVTGDFRLNLVKWKQENFASISETCIHFAFRSPSSIFKWEALYNKQGPQALLELRRGRKLKTDHTTRQRSRPTTTSTPKTEASSTKRKLIIKDTTRCLKKIDGLEKASKKELAQVINELKAKYLLKDLIDALPISMSTYQHWQKQFKYPNEDKLELKTVIKGLFNYYVEYGVRRLSAQVRAYYQLIGKTAPNHKRIQRLMHEMNLKCTKCNQRRCKYDSSKGPNGKKAKNKLNRRFMSNRKYQKMVCDITEFKAYNGQKVYLEVIKDLATKQILTWAIGQSPTLHFALTPLQKLLYQVTIYWLSINSSHRSRMALPTSRLAKALA